MDSQARGLIKGLENWAKKVTKGYRDVDVRDMSSSFRNGLAFCAIIHHYRPDLIDFDSLSKENILENNQMAFGVAEKQLGVPALLDAEDMVEFPRPDRLSIITYLSQLHNCFENQNKVKAGFKRIQNNNVTGPPSKIIAAEPRLLTTRRVENCQVCNNRVFILERLIVNGKLYHTACFRCCKCNCLLNPGAYVESDVPGKYECSVCLPEEKTNSMETDDTGSHSSLEEKNHTSLNSVTEPLHPIHNNVASKSPLSESVTQARVSFLQRSLSPKSSGANGVPLPKLEGISPTSDKLLNSSEKELPSNGVSVRAKISAFESSSFSKSQEPKSIELTSPVKPIDSSTPNRTSLIENSLNKSPRPSSRLSLISSVSSKQSEALPHNDSDEKTFLNSSTIDKIDIASSLDFSKTSKDLDVAESSSDKLNCDNASQKSTPSEVPSPEVNVSPIQNSPSTLRTFRKDADKNSEPFRKSVGEYKSPLKTSRDIFQTNIQPLKLSIPTINTSTKKEPTSLPITPLLTSPDSIKSPTEIAQIRPTYPRNLARPLSYSSLPPKEKSVETTENNLSSVLHSKWSGTTARRRSLDSDKNNEIIDDKSPNLTSTKAEVSSINNISSSAEVDGSAYLFSKASSLSRLTRTAVSGSAEKITPVPSVRRSLELRKSELTPRETVGAAKKSELKSITSILTSGTAAETSPKSDGVASPTKSLTPKDNSSLEVPSAKPDAIPVEAQAEESYPDDLNPFGDDEIKEEEEYPDDLNPFGDDEEIPPKVFEGVSADNYDESKNPFASDEEEAESASHSSRSPRLQFSQNSSPFGTMSSPTGSLRGTAKKRKAPKPPPKMSDIFPSDSPADPSKSLKSSPAVSRKGLETPSPKLRKNKPAPPPPPVPSPRQTSQTDVKQSKDADNMKLKSSAAKESAKQQTRKKRPAPPVPIPMRKDKKKIPLKEIMREMKEIEAKQREFEKQGREIELLIRDRDKDEEASVEEEEYIMQLFELVNQKNALFRRQAELMYIKRSQRLEEQQEELEKQIRQLMAKPENEKTEEDKIKEEELIYELTDIVDQRNSIIDSIEMDRRRELEEDVSVQEHIEIKNGELPIAAEIKEKSKGKEKKEKKKKEKKKKDKHHENGESGKSTLKRKLFK